MLKIKLYPCFKHWLEFNNFWLFSDPHFNDTLIPDPHFSDIDLITIILYNV